MTRTLAVFALLALLSAPQTRADDSRSLTADELSALQEQVRVACQLPPEEDARVYPWYFHYELGVALGEKQDWRKAVDALLVALDKRPGPSEHGRTYGMWFLAYRPYFHLGLAQYQLGNFACATDAFSLSKKLGEIPSGDALATERETLARDATRMKSD